MSSGSSSPDKMVHAHLHRECFIINAFLLGIDQKISGDPPIPNNSNGCIPNHGLGGSPGVITCKDGVPTTDFCSNIFKSCSGAYGSASCKVFGF